jgi:hypothetical protein
VRTGLQYEADDPDHGHSATHCSNPHLITSRAYSKIVSNQPSHQNLQPAPWSVFK